MMLHIEGSGRTGLALMSAVVFVMVGCGGGGDFGESVVVPQEKQTPVDATFGAGRPLTLPGDAPFNVADAQRFSEGDASAEAAADAAGKAGCSVSAREDGSAWAEFQLGHVLTNPSDQAFDATVTFDVSYSYRTAGEMTPAAGSPDVFALKIYIMDSDRRTLKKFMLAQLKPDKGPVRWSGKQAPAFDVTLQPRLAYHLVLAGRVEVSGTQERSPSATIEVQSLDISVIPKS